MSHDPEKYVYFSVGLLKNSFALEALSEDALRYHLIDQPGKLIALRLTEYYEMMARGNLRPGASIQVTAKNPAFGNGASPTAGQIGEDRPDDGGILAASPDVEVNADEAADYWARL